MKIINVAYSAGQSAYYFDDQAAIKAGASQDGFMYRGLPQTEGFQAIRQRGETVCVLLQLESGIWAQGECVAVQYSGAGGRDPLFTAERFIPELEAQLTPVLLGRDVTDFRDNAQFVDQLDINGSPLHTAIRYGASQALLDGAAKAAGRLACDVIRAEWGLAPDNSDLPLFGQSGDDRHINVDKMILRGVPALPHGLINNIPNKLGRNGGKLLEYVSWLTQRIESVRTDPSYAPRIHIDVYGTIGMVFDDDPVQMAAYIARLERRAFPFELYIEGPCDVASKPAQIETLLALRAQLRKIDSRVKIVADEWCNTLQDVRDFVDARCCDMVQIKTPDLGSIHNTIDAVLYCKGTPVEAYQGGSCNETDMTARACIHAAFATRPDRVLVKPGMGFDEGMCIVANEAGRIQTISKANEITNEQSPLEAV